MVRKPKNGIESRKKMMIINFSRKYQFTTPLEINGKSIDVVDETKLLGTVITSDLKWKRNTEELVKKAYSRMQILHKIAEYGPKIEDMKTIFILYVRSILEQSCVVWGTSLTQENSEDIQRVQKSAVKLILKDTYE